MMKEQVQNLKRQLWREFTLNCHFYTITLESMKDRTLLIVNQLSFGFKVATDLHVSFTSIGLKKNSSVQRALGITSEPNKEQTLY